MAHAHVCIPYGKHGKYVFRSQLIPFDDQPNEAIVIRGNVSSIKITYDSVISHPHQWDLIAPYL